MTTTPTPTNSTESPTNAVKVPATPLATHKQLVDALACHARAHPNGPYACPPGGLHYGLTTLRFSTAAEWCLKAADLERVYEKVTEWIATDQPHYNNPETAPVGAVTAAWNDLVKSVWTDDLAPRYPNTGEDHYAAMGRALAERLGVA